MKLLNMIFSPASHYFILSLCSSRNVRGQVSHPYKTASKIIQVVVLDILFLLFFFSFLDIRAEDNTVSLMALQPLWALAAFQPPDLFTIGRTPWTSDQAST
jgi:hypothetical protein